MQFDKPIRCSYINNTKHKQTQIRKVKLYMINYLDDGRSYLFDGNWNHKKTNAQKAVWSCGGYGGKCASCKSANNFRKPKQRKNYYQFNGVQKHFF